MGRAWGRAHESGSGAGEFATAIWTSWLPTWEQVEAAPHPWFPPVPILLTRRANAILAWRMLTRPVAIARALRRGASYGDVKLFLRFLDTAAVFGIRDLRDADGNESPLQPLLRRVPRLDRDDANPMISGVILTRDEEHRIKKAIESLRQVAEEIVVIDDGSQDGTWAIAVGAGAKVESHPLNADFAAQRNYATTCTTGSWIVYLDADEVITPLPPALAPALASRRVDVIMIPRLDYWPRAGRIEEACVQTRMHRRQSKWGFHPVHAQVIWTRYVTLPMTPLVEHYKTVFEVARSGLMYARVDPTMYSAEQIAIWESIIEEAERR